MMTFKWSWKIDFFEN